jgi:D-lactate dehydrogenase (cytochrome)
MKPQRPETIIQPLEARYRDYLTDESRITGTAESISFPENEAQVQAIVKRLLAQKTPITVQGSRTGITGGAVPTGGHILNLSKMTRVMGLEQDPNGRFALRVEPGLCLWELERQLLTGRFNSDSWDKRAQSALAAFHQADRQFWPPDPSEKSASIGGMAANDAWGICAPHYGPTRDHIQRIRVVDAQGEIHLITRGQFVFSEGRCLLPGGRRLEVDPAILGADAPKDLMDLYLGSEGMLGVITELTLRLWPLPRQRWGIVFFFQTQHRAVDFIEKIHRKPKTEPDTGVVAIEFMDQTTLACIEEYKQVNSRLARLPDWPSRFASAVYIEIHGSRPQDAESLSEWLLETSGTGDDPKATWAFCGETEMEQMRLLRCAAPEAVHLLIDQARRVDSRIIPTGIDLRFQDTCLSKMLEMLRHDLNADGLNAAIFGYGVNGPLHVHLLSQDYPQFIAGRTCVQKWTTQIYAQGGRVATGHGVGKIKNDGFRSIALPARLNVIWRLKQQFDPDRLWNPGNMSNFSGS